MSKFSSYGLPLLMGTVIGVAAHGLGEDPNSASMHLLLMAIAVGLPAALCLFVFAWLIRRCPI